MRPNLRKKEKERERRGEGRFASARLHGVTRKYGAPKASRPVQRGHNVSIQESSLEGPRGYVTCIHTRTQTSAPSCTPCLSAPLLPCSPVSRLRSMAPFDRSSPLCESVQQFAKGVPHTGPHRSPRYLNDQIFQFGIHHGVDRNHSASSSSSSSSSSYIPILSSTLQCTFFLSLFHPFPSFLPSFLVPLSRFFSTPPLLRPPSSCCC